MRQYNYTINAGETKGGVYDINEALKGRSKPAWITDFKVLS